MTEAMEALAGEPWCYRPHDIAVLTDHQIIHLYIGPAAERAKQFRRESGALPTPPTGPRPRDQDTPATDHQMSTKAEIVSMYLSYGISREDAERQYEEQMAEWRCRKGVT